MELETFDKKVINFFKKISGPISRLGLFVVFFWFGLLKVIDLSPASNLVQSLFEQTIPFISFNIFFILFGLFEMLIGILFIFKGLERIVIPLLFIHMIMTFCPLIFLPGETWSSFMVPTLEGQYIIKNLALIAVAIGIASHLHPMSKIRNII
jgi:uncharacterized membrane protein YkgB